MNTTTDITRGQYIERIRRQGICLSRPTKWLVQEWLLRPRVAIVALIATKWGIAVEQLASVSDWIRLNAERPSVTFETMEVRVVSEVLLQ